MKFYAHEQHVLNLFLVWADTIVDLLWDSELYEPTEILNHTSDEDDGNQLRRKLNSFGNGSQSKTLAHRSLFYCLRIPIKSFDENFIIFSFTSLWRKALNGKSQK